MDIMLPCKFSLPFFHLSFVNNRDKVCFQREYKHKKLIHRRRQASFLSLSLSLSSLMYVFVFCGEEKPNRSIHTAQMSRNSIF